MSFLSLGPLLALVVSVLWVLSSYRVQLARVVEQSRPVFVGETGEGGSRSVPAAHNSLARANERLREGVQETLVNRVTGETWFVMQTERETGGELWEMYELMAPGGFVNVEHIHPYQEEVIAVVNGSVRLLLGARWERPWAREYVLGPGDVAVVPAGVSHGLSNQFADKHPERQGSTLMRVEYRPALRDMQLFFRTLAGLSQDNGLNERGIPHPLHAALIWERFPGLAEFWWLPAWAQDLATLALAPLARLMRFSIDQYYDY